MQAKEEHKPSPSWTLFPVQQKNEVLINYACDFSDELGVNVYKGYQCTTLKTEQMSRSPYRVKRNELEINREKPVAIKLYDSDQSPSPYQHYASNLAILTVDNHDVLIMDYIEGFHIHPDHKNNEQLKQLSFFQAVDVAWQMVLGLNHLHYQNSSGIPIVHGDIKGENVKIRIKKNAENQSKIDVFYLDMDYAKPIASNSILIQGTVEHLALELLEGDYSESSDFFALSPLLLSLFGAYNPFKEIIAFRDDHKHLESTALIKGFRAFDFSAEGLFTHFEKKPPLFIAQILELFILRMGAKDKKRRPAPEAILEFFTALRQFCLVDTLDQDNFILRMAVASGETRWLTEPKSLTLFFSLSKQAQTKLINLMNFEQSAGLFKKAMEQHPPHSAIEALRVNIANELREQSEQRSPPSRLALFFHSYVSKKELQWLLECYENNNTAEFYSAANEKIRIKLQKCSEKIIASIITVIIEGIEKPAEITARPKLS